jgi:Raf kinase inhibitor-like YbhB/YbcL family protein
MLENLPPAIGRALRGARPGLEKLAYNDPALAELADSIVVTSPDFADGEALPVRYTADGEGISPPIAWSGVPDEAKMVVVLIEDADSPTPYPLVHAIVWNLPPEPGSLEAGAMPLESEPGQSPTMGVNSYLRIGYLPPDPPPGHGPHHYAFQVFALTARPELDTSAPGRTELVDSLHAYAVAKGLMIGTYERE